VVVENDDFRFFRSLPSEHLTYMATRQLSGDTTVDDLVIKVIRLFHIKFRVIRRNYYRLLIHTYVYSRLMQVE